MANRYIELIYSFQSELKRELTIEEIQHIKRIVAQEFDHSRYITVKAPVEYNEKSVFAY